MDNPQHSPDALVEKVALSMGLALKRDCNHLGECYAWADDERSYEDNILAEVDGEIDLEKLARAALEAAGVAELREALTEAARALEILNETLAARGEDQSLGAAAVATRARAALNPRQNEEEGE